MLKPRQEQGTALYLKWPEETAKDGFTDFADGMKVKKERIDTK